MTPISVWLCLILPVCRLSPVTAQLGDDDWVDPYDMLNYDPTAKSMKKPAEIEPTSYQNVPTRRRQPGHYSNLEELTACKAQAAALRTQIEDQKKKNRLISQQPTCNPVFRRFLSRLLKDIQRVGTPSDSADTLFDAKIKLSKQSMAEIQKLLEGEDSWRTGALDDAISQILVDIQPHDSDHWKWHFEDTFGVELDTLLKVGFFILIIMAIISTQLWSTVSWFVQFHRLFAICFLVSIVWNWFYLYKIAFAEHQNNIVKMDSVNEKCTGVKKIDWRDSLKEWFRSTWTLQDDPCLRYYEVLMVNPILLVPPTKAISVTITTFITEPLKHFGQGISEFLRALLKDLPVTLQIPVLLAIVLSIVVCMYGGVQAAFQYGITAPFRRHRRDQHPRDTPELEPHQRRRERINYYDHPAGGDAPQQRHNRALLHQNRNNTDADSTQPQNNLIEEVGREGTVFLVRHVRQSSQSENTDQIQDLETSSEGTDSPVLLTESETLFMHDITAPLRRRRKDRLPPDLTNHHDTATGGDTSQHRPIRTAPAQTQKNTGVVSTQLNTQSLIDEVGRHGAIATPQPVRNHPPQRQPKDQVQGLTTLDRDTASSLSQTNETIPVQETSPTVE